MIFPVPDMDEVHAKLQVVYLGDEESQDQTDFIQASMQHSLVQSLRGVTDQIGMDMLMQMSVECPHCQQWVTVLRLLRYGDCPHCQTVLVAGYRQLALRGVKRMQLVRRLFELIEAEPYAEVICDS